ncbi:MAG: hypothetical protein LJE69_11415 [Thiohalocapsa sp.]|uniref:hypothetical protein n=1 Tax=Thiohalocapsa sp. TaxID=2497641 RepID=UPI0025FC1ABA|nr:hypothetical protein [Thiohalocapsa sp.]MCG6941843.1 hypothetical protein [Thiohalocapsa sp.]
MTDLALTITGDDAEAAAGELAAALGLDALPAADPAATGTAETAVTRGIDPALAIAGAALVFSIPPGVLAAMDIAGRAAQPPEGRGPDRDRAATARGAPRRGDHHHRGRPGGARGPGPGPAARTGRADAAGRALTARRRRTRCIQLARARDWARGRRRSG